jgi:serine/threonine protein kinase
MGMVYEARDHEKGKRVALKVLLPHARERDDGLLRFKREYRALARLRHPHIIRVYDAGIEDDWAFIAMEFLDGQPLDEALRESSPNLETIVGIGEKVAGALDYSHQRGIVHRDIKPSNIMLTRDGQIKITDFGIARIEDPTAPQMTQAGEILGTPNYMSPEQVRGEPVDGRSDLYSLGVILYELSTGRRPYAAKNLAAIFHAILNDTPASPMDIEPFVSRGLPSELSDILLKSIDKSPDTRFQSGGEMAEAISACRAPSRPHAQAPLPEKKSNLPLVAALVFVLIVLIAGGGYFYFRQPGEQPEVEAPVPRGILVAESDPEGAQLYVDGTLQGKTPIDLELPLGKHEIRFFLPGYDEWAAQVELEEPETPLKARLWPEEEDE